MPALADMVAMVTASTPDVTLPRAGALTDALLACTTPKRTTPTRPFAVGVAAARRRLELGIAQVVADAGTDPEVRRAPLTPLPPLLRIGHYQVARALEGLRSPARPAEGATSFRWTARAARRSIGLAAVRAGLDGRAPTPADAVAGVMADPDGPFGVGRTGPGSCADWIASLASPARTLVAAEATAWATRLWTAVDWARLAPHRLVVGGPDRWWRWSDPSGRCRVAVRGRADVRIGDTPGDDGILGAHLVVLDGQPEPVSRHALLVSALVDALSSPGHRELADVPGRVIGWWPDCGKSWIVPVDTRTLVGAADAVVSTACALLEKGTPGR